MMMCRMNFMTALGVVFLVTSANVGRAQDAAVNKLQVHSSDLALGATSGGVATEIVGADQTGNLSLPDTDLNIGTGDVLYDQISMGTLAPIDRGTAKSYFNLAAKETMTTLNGTPKVTVVIEWYGRPAVAL